MATLSAFVSTNGSTKESRAADTGEGRGGLASKRSAVAFTRLFEQDSSNRNNRGYHGVV